MRDNGGRSSASAKVGGVTGRKNLDEICGRREGRRGVLKVHPMLDGCLKTLVELCFTAFLSVQRISISIYTYEAPAESS
jgi:hypothetical protein